MEKSVSIILHFVTYPGQVDCPRRDMNVHEIVNDPALDVALVLVDQDLFSSIKNLHEAIASLQLLVHGLVLVLVVLDAVEKVLECFLFIHPVVVGAIDLYFLE